MAQNCHPTTFFSTGEVNVSILKGAYGWCSPVSMTVRKRTVLSLMGRSEMGVEGRELRCHQVINLLPLKPKKAA